jgi:hypothetical protein
LAAAVVVPERVAVPSPSSTKDRPEGSVPVKVRTGVGELVVVTTKVLGLPTVNTVAAGLVNTGVWFTTSVKGWLADPAALTALIVSGYVPLVPAAGVPDSVPFPLPLSTKDRPVGKVPVGDSAAAGDPVLVNLKVVDLPTTNVAVAALVIVGT